MKNKTAFLVIALSLLSIVTKGQSLNLNDCIKLHKSDRVTIDKILQAKSSKWNFSDGMWTYDDGLNATFLRKTDGDQNNSEIIVITNNKSIIKTLNEDIKRNRMSQDGTKSVFIGSNYVVGFITETNKFGEKIYSIHIMPKSMY